MLRPLPFFWFMLTKLPSITFWNIRIKQLGKNGCQTILPFTWRTQNPFRSVYFATLAGAAELASGALCMLHLTGKKEYSMLVTDFEATFSKKATGTVSMTCEDGPLLLQTLEKLEKPGDVQTLRMAVTGTNENGDVIGNFAVTWSFKRKG
ncbi:DUF4442 domain-containing protein [Negadavirga shengliensis]|uniref:DUF4442 domain-containing protein n=2 Tax=Negadavirga shengliensis TaxID=1389218 RepID=A0ABV9T1U7_9BACT